MPAPGNSVIRMTALANAMTIRSVSRASPLERSWFYFLDNSDPDTMALAADQIATSTLTIDIKGVSGFFGLAGKFTALF